VLVSSWIGGCCNYKQQPLQANVQAFLDIAKEEFVATVTRNLPEVPVPEGQGTVPLDPELLYTHTGMTLEQLEDTLGQLSPSELNKLVEVLTVIDDRLRLMDPDVQEGMRHLESLVADLEEIAKRSTDVF
jgi:hypothetical protein